MTGRRKKPKRISCGSYTSYTPAFSLSVEQRSVILDWRKSHDVRYHGSPNKKTSAIGGAYTYELTPTSLGTVTVVRCWCGEAIDVSDYNDW